MIQAIARNLPCNRVKSKKGFTLAELLIVVAIIAILIAVAIPVFSAQLKKANNATDDANIRAAKAAATVAFLDGNGAAITGKFFDADAGVLVGTSPTVKYGKSDAARPGSGSVAPAGKVLSVAVAADGTVTLGWVA